MALWQTGWVKFSSTEQQSPLKPGKKSRPKSDCRHVLFLVLKKLPVNWLWLRKMSVDSLEKGVRSSNTEEGGSDGQKKKEAEFEDKELIEVEGVGVVIIMTGRDNV
ncbi:hypothetical protein RRG08_055457 [Elysia crispata]|uniref:Uncharacterized protein n=1 Tax=Elysia crispata TaxID=231223 RepID=A0AAE1A972_9GAST|nr:hypothetical protein RRG08_055457 [Elysia crispata]